MSVLIRVAEVYVASLRRQLSVSIKYFLISDEYLKFIIQVSLCYIKVLI